MNTINVGGVASTAMVHIRQIKARTWVIVGTVLLSCFAPATWAAIAILGALWGGAQSLVGAAPNMLDTAKQQVAQHAETLSSAAREQLAQTLPQLPTSADHVKAELAKQAEILSQNARDKLAQAAPNVGGVIDHIRQVDSAAAAAAATAAAAAALTLNSAAGLPAEAQLVRDVSGADLGPTRFPGLARVAWCNDAQGGSVRYEGRADYHNVLSHYQREFTARGYTQSVLSATPEQETLRFSKDSEVLTAKVTRSAALVFVEIATAPPATSE
jgi:hypothetical protein